MRLELVRHPRRGLGVGQQHERGRKVLALPGEHGEVEVVQRHDEAHVVLLAQPRERRHVLGRRDPRDDHPVVAVVQRRRERIRVDAERDRTSRAERAGDVDALPDGCQQHDHRRESVLGGLGGNPRQLRSRRA
jgi:hypothetical protein